MGHCIAKLADDEYVEWSTVVDAPVTYICTRAVAVNAWGEERVARADAHGHTFKGGLLEPGIDALLSCNRAGPNETEATLAEIRVRCTASGAVEGTP